MPRRDQISVFSVAGLSPKSAIARPEEANREGWKLPPNGGRLKCRCAATFRCGHHATGQRKGRRMGTLKENDEPEKSPEGRIISGCEWAMEQKT